MTLTDQRVFLIGSGASISALTETERSFLDAHPRTLAMNKFLLFHEQAGFVPRYLFLADRHFPAQKVFLESLHIAKRLASPITFYVNDYYQKLLEPSHSILQHYVRQRLSLLRHHRFWFPLRLSPSAIHYFQSGLHNETSFFWADHLSEPLYFYRGSLTTALNLISVIFPACDIYLVGVDLNTPRAFYEHELRKRPDLLDRYHTIGRQKGIHPTVAAIDDFPGILSVFPAIQEALAHRSINLYCCNPDSLLVQEGFCSFKPILA